MMILPLADALMNCLQNLTSRVAGINNEEMTGRVMGMGAMLGFGVSAIKEQFKTPTTSNNTNNSNSNGLKGFVSRAKSVISPTMNLSDEKDYNGNINPIRNVIQNSKNINNSAGTSTINNTTTQSEKAKNNNIPRTVITNVAKTGYNATKAYLKTGASLVEGDFDKSTYSYNSKRNKNNKKNNFHNTEYITKINSINEQMQKVGDEDNEFERKDKKQNKDNYKKDSF